jgi:hemerythrin-like metal-binding protein
VHQLHWNNQFSVGNPALDIQHLLIFEMMNEGQQAIAGGTLSQAFVENFMDRLAIQIESHFAYEESLVELGGLKFPADHAEHHRDVLLRVKGIALSIGQNYSQQFALTHELLCKWTIKHILEDDKQYVPLLREVGLLLPMPASLVAAAQTPGKFSEVLQFSVG